LGTDGRFPLVDAEFAGGDLCIPGTLDPAVVEGAIVLCRRGAVGRADKSFAVFEAGGVGMVLYNETDDDNLFTDPHSVPSVHIDLTPGLKLKEYIAENTNPVAKISTGNVTRWRSAPGMTIFSSRGPNPVAPDIIKPDLTAPGLQILAGASPINVGYVQGELFQAIAGTSMSSPHVAGVFALIKQAHPTWSAAVAKSALMTTADTDVVDNDRETQANPFEMGAGMIDPGGNRRGSAFNPGLAYDAGFFEYVGFLCGAAPGVVDPAFCADLEAGGIPTLAYNLNVPSIGVSEVPGTRTIMRTVTNVSGRSLRVEAEVKKPKGFDVSVSPRRLNIPAGGSATFEVTFTTTKAPIGEWRFGSLTWEGGGYEVRSPIAVKAAQIEVPETVTGTGEIGTASFPVSFGYTGAYSAEAHGLVTATLTVDNVLQDGPEAPAEFSPSDVATGGANAHTFNLSGAAVFKLAIPPEATEAEADLDVYVYNPDNVLVAASTSGGTDEEVIIENPADGTWTVYVHGWTAPGGDSDYTMYSWVISATPGGTLMIDNAPASATAATTGTVDISWSGAVAGEWHLGAVSHHDEDSVIGLTFVEVDNRP
jgi:hypothetical protein